MNDEEFLQFADQLAAYLEREKTFFKNPKRITEVEAAGEIARKMFPEAIITIKDDPLQMGALILCIEDIDIAVREIERFKELIGKANNFEVYPVGDERVRLSVVFNKALLRL
jgi:hypothetical protein